MMTDNDADPTGAKPDNQTLSMDEDNMTNAMNHDSTPLAPTVTAQDMAVCVHCSYSGSDVFFSCASRCPYHARCLDLVAVQRSCMTAPVAAEANGSSCHVKMCLNCKSEATSLELIPLALDSIKIGRSKESFASSMGGKRPFQSESAQSSEGYDLNTPRTGRWVASEIAFRDALLSHFISGALPLRDDCKLLDFLSDILKSKQSRLTKKMKHANLSVQHYCYLSGYLPKYHAVELGRLEKEFIDSLPDHEQRELRFHMSRLWRDHLADRLSFGGIPFDPSAWIDSVETLEKRLTDKQEQERMVKRRIMMGKAWHVDSKTEEGVFVDGADVDFDSFISLMEGNEDGAQGEQLAGDAEMKSIFSAFASGPDQATVASDTSADEPHSSTLGNPSSFEPNFRFAAPFLAWIISYMERTNMPFEHVDIWCPSSLPNDVCGSMAPPPSTLGSGVQVPPNCRLYFAGSASSSKQMVPKSNTLEDSKSALISIPMASDEIESLSLFGHYSEKFSFSNGCGLPGRVFNTGQPEWNPYLLSSPPSSFERRGGAMQFGIQTAAALPIRCSNVGRIVVAFYSRTCRERDDELIDRITRDVQAMNPCPRFKLTVDMGDAKEANTEKSNTAAVSSMTQQPPGSPTLASLGRIEMRSPSFNAMRPQPQVSNLSQALSQSQVSNLSQAINETQDKSRSLVAFLCENMPSDGESPLSSQLNNIMALRLLLLRKNRPPNEEDLVESMLVLFESYRAAQRSSTDITMMLARDFAFHDLQLKQSAMQNGSVQQLVGNSPPHHIAPTPNDQGNSMPHLSLDASNHSVPGFSSNHIGSLGSLPGHMSAFSLNSVDYKKNPM